MHVYFAATLNDLVSSLVEMWKLLSLGEPAKVRSGAVCYGFFL